VILPHLSDSAVLTQLARISEPDAPVTTQRAVVCESVVQHPMKVKASSANDSERYAF
jgi:hypothetical protein